MYRTLVYALRRVHTVIQPSSCSESLLLSGAGGLPSVTHSPAMDGRQVPHRQAVLLCHRGTKEGPDLGLAGLLGSGKLVRTFQRGGRRAWAGCGSSALATQLSPRCTFFPQRPRTSHVKASQQLGGSELSLLKEMEVPRFGGASGSAAALGRGQPPEAGRGLAGTGLNGSRRGHWPPAAGIQA